MSLVNWVLEGLLQSGLFQGLSSEVIRDQLLSRGRVKAFGAGQNVIFPQEAVKFLGVVLSGELCVLQTFSDGTHSLMKKMLPFYTIGADVACTTNKNSPYAVVASKDSKLFLMPYDVISEPGVLEEATRLTVIHTLLTLVSNDNMRKYYRIAILSQSGLRRKICIYLALQCEKFSSREFEISFTREELSSYLCVNRSALSHELGQMEAEGLIRFHKNHFEVLYEIGTHNT
ncbi:MAG: Crp/Fnr family transcriptional regulator [Oscillospiraceae bacterium]